MNIKPRASQDPAAMKILRQMSRSLKRADRLLDLFNAGSRMLLQMGYSTAPGIQFITAGDHQGMFQIGPDDFDRYISEDPEVITAAEIERAAAPKQPRRMPQSTVKQITLALGEEHGWTCQYCLRAGSNKSGPDSKPWHLEHRTPRVRGGSDERSNLTLSCATCNISKRAKTAEEFLTWRAARA